MRAKEISNEKLPPLHLQGDSGVKSTVNEAMLVWKDRETILSLNLPSPLFRMGGTLTTFMYFHNVYSDNQKQYCLCLWYAQFRGCIPAGINSTLSIFGFYFETYANIWVDCDLWTPALGNNLWTNISQNAEQTISKLMFPSLSWNNFSDAYSISSRNML